ncbi:phospholipase A2-like [Hydractinia symbiolongicarpus]|uniref:phospholipase A2-like n=1 Tax=Hydractinia symbiolongicarpus TaxID=13093 RepID=UPI002551C8F9|nr:phospholipase A2-like [Hydractinia symbiolongicarpus]
MVLTTEDVAVLKMLKNNEILGSLLDGEENMTEVRAFGWKIFPGTHWCGNGDIAKSDSDEDLGFFKKVDSCCRTHDKCPRSLNTGAKGYGTTNTGKYTASDCACDNQFKSCLKKVPKGKLKHVKTRLEYGSARLIGKIFFNFLKMNCLKFEEPQQADDISGDGADDSNTAQLVPPTPF